MVGIGECGLDFHYDLSPRDIQAQVFRAHIAAARETGLPLVVHTREADEVMGEILTEEHADGPFKLLMHCYTCGAELAETCADLGAWFSVSGIATFKAGRGRARRSSGHAGRPDHRGDRLPLSGARAHARPAQRAGLPAACLAKLAEIRGWSLDEVRARTEDAFFALFDRIPRLMSGNPDSHDPGSGCSTGVPRADGDWGACDPAEPEEPAHRAARPGSALSDGAGADTSGGRHLAGFPRADDPRRRAAARRGAVDPRSRRPDPRASTTCAPLPLPAAGASMAIWMRRPMRP